MVNQDIVTEVEYAKNAIKSLVGRRYATNEAFHKALGDIEIQLGILLDLTRLCMSENEHEYALKIIDFAKPCCVMLVETVSGMKLRELNDFMLVNDYVQDSKYNLYWDFVLEETYDRFEPYMLYMERKRMYSKKFYEKRMYTKSGKKAMKHIAERLQAFTDSHKKALTISLPPRTGKLLADYTPVFTKDGWKNHGDLVVGDYVVGLNGEFVKVTHVFPKNVANKRVTFSDGTQIDCHENHEWVVFDKVQNKERILETKYIEENLTCEHGSRLRFSIPNKKPIKGNKKQNWLLTHTFLEFGLVTEIQANQT